MKKLTIFYFCMLLLSCQQKSQENNSAVRKGDPHTYAKPDSAVVKHLDLDIKVDFEKHVISGKATWTIENPGKGTQIIFDTRQLQIEKVTTGDEEQETKFSLGKDDKFMGQPLTVAISPNTTKVTIWYTTSKDAAALQWLNPQQTGGKMQPFLYTQSEAILARTWVPCQDSPGIRFTYNASVTVPQNLLALMSAKNPQTKNASGVYEFKQEHPIPSYLMALAVGDLAFQKIDSRTGIYAEPSVLKKAAWEFADMGKIVDAGEKICGPYQWGRYDVLVLPPSFPFGGMENPNLTFATPTVIAGDRSLVNLIAHELAHSWSGNLVTNATWNDFWLNEGFAVYFERRIIEEVYGKNEAKMQEVLGREDLNKGIEELGATNPDTRLKTDFTGRDPDEGVTDIPYEKGYAFLRTIEENVARKNFDFFMRQYFIDHSFQSITTENFLDYMLMNPLFDEHKKQMGINAWVYEPGVPSNIPPATSQSFKSIDSIITVWSRDKKSSGLNKQIVSTNEKVYFIRKLPANITSDDMASLDKEMSFSRSGNAEVQCVWYTQSIRHQYKSAYPDIEKFLVDVGRRKFLTPLYSEMIKSPEGKKWAKDVYAKARPNYHSVSYNTIDELLK